MEKKKSEVMRKKVEQKKTKEKKNLDSFMKESKQIKLNEDYDRLLRYFDKEWSKDDIVKVTILNNDYLMQKYGKYIDPDFDWNSMTEEDLVGLWDEWEHDENLYGKKVNESSGSQKKGPKPLTVSDKLEKSTKKTGSKKVTKKK